MSASAMLNYHHLHYFWTVAREGSVAKACQVLHVAQPTISGQIRELEKSVGEPLFVRAGRGLRLTDTGVVVKTHCDAIFAAGSDLQRALEGGALTVRRLTIGISDSLPKLMAERLLAPALSTDSALTCIENSPERLFGELAVHQLDLVLSDTPIPANLGIKAHSHLLADSPLAIFAPARHPRLAALKKSFPAALEGEAMVLPTPSAATRLAFDEWLRERGVRVRVAAECQDGALIKAFGQAGVGCFPGTALISAEIERMYEAVRIGTVELVRERFYAVTLDRRSPHPGVQAILAKGKTHG